MDKEIEDQVSIPFRRTINMLAYQEDDGEMVLPIEVESMP